MTAGRGITHSERTPPGSALWARSCSVSKAGLPSLRPMKKQSLVSSIMGPTKLAALALVRSKLAVWVIRCDK